jgi:hypothetical protein
MACRNRIDFAAVISVEQSLATTAATSLVDGTNKFTAQINLGPAG